MNRLKQIIADIDVYTDRDRASLDLFEMAVEKEWGTRLLLAKEIYHTEPIYYERETQAELMLLEEIKDYYLVREEFERCGKIQSLLDRLNSENGVETFIADFIKRNDVIF